jgi:ketosteroid isomerase-like protein
MKGSPFILLFLMLSISVVLVSMKRSSVSLYATSLNNAFISYDLMNAPGLSEKSLIESLNVKLDEANDKWMEDYNKKAGDVSECYTEQCVLFPENGKAITGKADIAQFYSQKYPNVSKVKTVQVKKRFIETPTLIYEVGTLITDKQEIYPYMVSWNGSKGTWQRELEAMAKKTTSHNDSMQINAAREKWMQLCNAHDHKKLVENLYLKDAYYYNRGRVLEGWESLFTEYKYMSQPSYHLSLKPISVMMVQPDLAYEVGKCSGSYGGHYMLVWEKQRDGEWKVCLDSNY